MMNAQPGLRLPSLSFVIPIVVFLSVGFAAASTPPAFPTERLINTVIPGMLPFDVRTADLDQDGDLDIYAANYSGRLTWFENDGAHPPGPWVEHVVTDFADGAEAIVACRVDGDADIDFLSAAFNRDEIAWYDNGGNGETWTTVPITFNVPLAVDVWAADLDGDGDNDALSASGLDGRIAWYENTGFPNNHWTQRIIPSASGQSIEAADIDQDGDLDVVVGTNWFESNGGSPPSFKRRVMTTLPLQATAIAVLDVDRDGDLDVLTAGQDDDRIDWLENDGSQPPGWILHPVSATADFATGVYGADLDGDADVDLLSSSFMDNTIAWYENDGGTPPSWTRRAISTNAMGARSVFAADLDQDGDMDVIRASQSDQKVVWHVNDANYADADRDGMRDDLDCAPTDGTAFRVPREVSGVRFYSRTLLAWNSAVAGSGGGAVHDVMRGVLVQLPPGSGAAETCVANNTAARTLTEGTVPMSGTGFYYLVRAANACGIGSYGAGTSGAPRSSATCP